MAASRVHPAGRVVWWGKEARNNSRMHSAAGKLAVAGNGHGVIVGCMQRYQNRWGFARMTTSRAAWPHALHDEQQRQQQREKSRRKQISAFRRPELFLVRQHRGARGTDLVVIVGFS